MHICRAYIFVGPCFEYIIRGCSNDFAAQPRNNKRGARARPRSRLRHSRAAWAAPLTGRGEGRAVTGWQSGGEYKGRQCEASFKFSHRIEDAVGLNIDWIYAAIMIACVIIQQGEGFSMSGAIR